MSSFNYTKCVESENESVLLAYHEHKADGKQRNLGSALLKAALVCGPLAALLVAVNANAAP